MSRYEPYRVSVHSLAKGDRPARLVVCTTFGAEEAVRVVLRAASWLGLDVSGVVIQGSARLDTARADGVGWSVVASAVNGDVGEVRG